MCPLGHLGITAALLTQSSKSSETTSRETNGVSKGRSKEYLPWATPKPVKAPIKGLRDSHTSTANFTSERVTSVYFVTRSWELVTTTVSSTTGLTASTTCLIKGLLASARTPLSCPNLLEKPPASTIADLPTCFSLLMRFLTVFQAFYKRLHQVSLMLLYTKHPQRQNYSKKSAKFSLVNFVSVYFSRHLFQYLSEGMIRLVLNEYHVSFSSENLAEAWHQP